jgi:hypothetical protein
MPNRGGGLEAAGAGEPPVTGVFIVAGGDNPAMTDSLEIIADSRAARRRRYDRSVYDRTVYDRTVQRLPLLIIFIASERGRRHV